MYDSGIKDYLTLASRLTICQLLLLGLEPVVTHITQVPKAGAVTSSPAVGANRLCESC